MEVDDKFFDQEYLVPTTIEAFFFKKGKSDPPDGWHSTVMANTRFRGTLVVYNKYTEEWHILDKLLDDPELRFCMYDTRY